jgi:tartrate-resistant acid phosphatase type 5
MNPSAIFHVPVMMLGLIACPQLLSAGDDVYSMVQGVTLTANGLGGNPAGVLANDDAGATVATLATAPAFGNLVLSPNGTFTYTPPPNAYGTVTFTYTENSGGIVGSTVSAATTTSTWKYLNPLTGVNPDNGSNNFNATWKNLNFADATWGDATGVMGYGTLSGVSGGLAITTDIGVPVSGQRRTAYFRHHFNSPYGGRGSLRIKIVREDSAIVYVNGVEAGRAYEAGAEALFATAPDTWDLMIPGIPAAWTSEGDEETTVHDLTFPNVNLVVGDNVLAVSVHNNLNPSAPTSSDLGLKVELAEITGVVASTPRTVTINIADGHLPPILMADSYTVSAGQGLNTTVQGLPSTYVNDGILAASSGDAIFEDEVQLSGPASARISFNADNGHFTYTPPVGFQGTDTFTYAVRDKDGWSAPATVQIQVQAAPFSLTWTAAAPSGVTRYSSTLPNESINSMQTKVATVALRQGQWLAIEMNFNIYFTLGVFDSSGNAVPSVRDGFNHLTTRPVPSDGNYIIQVSNFDIFDLEFSLRAEINAYMPLGLIGSPARMGNVFASTGNGGFAPITLVVSQASSSQVEIDLPASASTLQAGWEANAGSVLPTSLRVENLTTGQSVTHVPTAHFRPAVMTQSTLGNLSGAKIRLTLQTTIVGINGYFSGAAILAVNQALENEPTSPADQLEALPVLNRTGFIGAGGGAASGHTFALFGDFGANNANELGVANMVKSWTPEYIVTLGDNNYLGAGVGGAWESAVGNFYGDFIKARSDGLYPKQTATTPKFFPVPGNHDYTGGTGTGTAAAVIGGNCAGFIDYFVTNGAGGAPRLPISTGRANSSGIYYDFVQHSCHFFMIDSNQTLTNAAFLTETQTWLTNRIAASTARWKILVCHHSSYGSSTSYGTTSQMTWVTTVPGIDVVLQGHAHIYERILINNKLVLNVGTGGTSLYILGPALPEDQFRAATFGAVRGTSSENGLKFEFFPSGATTPTDTHLLGSLTGNDRDLYTFNPTALSVTRIAARAKLYPLGLANALQPKLELLDSSDNVLATAQAPAAGGVAELEWPQTTAPTGLKLRVSAVGSGQGEYVLEETPHAPANYAAWTGLHFPGPNAPNSLPDDDADADQVSNFLEYALNTQPNANDATQAHSRMLLPTRSASGDVGVELTQPDTLPTDLTWEVQYSATLNGNWNPVATRAPSGTWQLSGQPAAHVISTTDIAGHTSFRFLRAASNGHGFYRLMVARAL